MAATTAAATSVYAVAVLNSADHSTVPCIYMRSKIGIKQMSVGSYSQMTQGFYITLMGTVSAYSVGRYAVT